MGKHTAQLVTPRYSLFFGLLILFSAMTFPLNPGVSGMQISVVLLVWLYYRQQNRIKQRELLSYLEQITGDLDAPIQDNLEQSPLPMVVFRPETGEVIWANAHFLREIIQEETLSHGKITDLLPEFDGRWILEGKSQSPTEQIVNNRRFLVFGSLMRANGKSGGSYLASTYWVEVTELSQQRDLLRATRPTVAVIMVDNYEDLLRNLTESQSSAILSAINTKIGTWIEGTNGILRRYARESYLMILEQQELDQLIQKKFEILDSMHEIVNPSGIAASLSIGVGTDGETLEETMKHANLSIEMALTRGGDQVVIRNKITFEFYGGRATETEKRTKVKSRVMANALSSLIADSSRVFIMGHKFPDMDAVGAAAGVFALCRKKATPSYLIHQGESSAEELYQRLGEQADYHERFITTQEALVLADSRSLVVVVDTNRPDQVQAPEVLESCTRVAVIDHHRRGSSYIEGAVLNYHELYASSACELVSELLQYTIEPTDLLRAESEALLAGIVLDTKNFTLRTGGRTFEAAAFLRRCGADTNEVKKLFQNDLEGAISRYKIVQSAQVFREAVAIAWTNESVGRVVAAQAADELLNIRGVDTSFVLSGTGSEVLISGRSMGSMNVQMVLESLGGGGNAASAGAQLQNIPVEEGLKVLKQAISQYLDEEK